jgi:hypothetical protein
MELGRYEPFSPERQLMLARHDLRHLCLPRLFGRPRRASGPSTGRRAGLDLLGPCYLVWRIMNLREGLTLSRSHDEDLRERRLDLHSRR